MKQERTAPDSDIKQVAELATRLGRISRRLIKTHLRFGSARADAALKAFREENPRFAVPAVKPPTPPAPSGRQEKVTTEESGGQVQVRSEGRRIKTLEQLLKAARVDQDVWRVERWKANTWEAFARDKNNELVTRTLHQVTAHLLPLVESESGRLQALAAETIALMRESVGAPMPPAPEPYEPAHGDMLLEISVPDLHIGKYAWAEESGIAWDLDAAEAAYRSAMTDLLRKAAPFQPARTLLVIGNDLLHVDGPGNTTTRGTLQNVTSDWRAAFRRALTLTTWAVRAAQGLGAPVEVMVIPGNHATALEHALGEALAASLAASGVPVDTSPRPRKYFEWGSVLLGFAHGHSEQQGDLPAIMAAEAPEAWGRTTVREFHTGHLHQRRQRRRTVDVVELAEYHGVVVRILPALCPADTWHAQKGYIGKERMAEAYIWSRDGLEAILTGRPTGQ